MASGQVADFRASKSTGVCNTKRGDYSSGNRLAAHSRNPLIFFAAYNQAKYGASLLPHALIVNGTPYPPEHTRRQDPWPQRKKDSRYARVLRACLRRRQPVRLRRRQPVCLSRTPGDHPYARHRLDSTAIAGGGHFALWTIAGVALVAQAVAGARNSYRGNKARRQRRSGSNARHQRRSSANAEASRSAPTPSARA